MLTMTYFHSVCLDSSGANSDTSMAESCPLVNGNCDKQNSEGASDANNGVAVRIELAEERKRENNLGKSTL